MTEETKTEIKKVLDRVYEFTADKEVGMRYLLHKIAKEYGITLKKEFKKMKSEGKKNE